MDADQLAAIAEAWESIPDKYDVFQRLFLRLFIVSLKNSPFPFARFTYAKRFAHEREGGADGAECYKQRAMYCIDEGKHVRRKEDILIFSHADDGTVCHSEHEDHEFAIHFGLQDLLEEELRIQQKFRTHVCKFQRFIATIVDLLPKASRNDELIQIIRMVGRQHCNIKTMSFTAEKWLVFKKVLISVLCNDLNQGKLYECWSRLVSFVIYEMKDAYLDYIRHVRSNSCPHIPETITFFGIGRHPSGDGDMAVKLSGKN